MCIDFSQSVHYLLPYCVINKMYMHCSRMPLQPEMNHRCESTDDVLFLTSFCPPQERLRWSWPGPCPWSQHPLPSGGDFFLWGETDMAFLSRGWSPVVPPLVLAVSCTTYALFLRTDFSPLACLLVLASLVIFFRRRFHPRFVWQSRTAMLLYIFAPLFVREQVIGWWFFWKLDNFRSSFYDMWQQFRKCALNRMWHHLY